MMRCLRAALLLSVATLPATLSAQEQPQPPAASARIPSIPFTERTLANGLRVYAIRDTTTPNVSVQVWYDVGGRDDPRGRSGFAHLFEHLMFKATRNLVPEQMDRLTEDVGGYNNASTGDDYTNYFEVIPANHLQRLLFAEADRMASLVVEPTSFASERDVVKEEYRQGFARPYGKLFQTYLPEISYSVHPYARGVIGDVANLDSATIDDVRAFHATYYRPDNAILVVAGNFDPAQLNGWVDQYFAPIKRPAGEIPRVTVTEPPRERPVSRTVYEANTPLPAVLLSWQLPPDRDADVPALQVLDAIMATGENSRLYRSLVYRDELAQSAQTSFDTRAGTGTYAVFAIMAGGKDAAAGEAALRREVARFRDEAVTPAELAEAKNEILTAAIKRRETAEGKAFLLAQNVIINDDPTASDKQLAAVQRVTAADIQRVARKYLADNQSAVLRYLPEQTGKTGDTVTVAPTVVTRPLTAPADIAIVTPAPAGQRILPPPPAAPVKPVLPQVAETRLANGLRVITVERHDLPLVTASLVAVGGAATDPTGKAGASSLSAGLMTMGTTTRSAAEIARAVESLGGSIGSDASRDGASVDLTVTSDQLAPAMTILADVATHPAFAAEEIERARTQTIDGVAVAMKNPAQLSGLVASRVVFGNQPYGTPLEGTPTSLKTLTQADLKAAYQRTWQPGQAALVLVGDITPAAARTLAERYLGTWQGKGTAAALPGDRAAFPAPRVVVVDMPDAGQAGVVVARPGIARDDARYYPLAVANTVLGGGFSSRLNQEVRIKRGLAYGASSGLQAGRRPGLVAARTQTKNPSAAEVVTLISAEMEKLGQTPVPQAELATRQAVLVGNFGRTVETTDGIAGLLGDYVVQSVPLDELQRYTAKVEGVDPAAVQAAAAALLDPKAASIVVVGDARQFLPALKARYPQVEVVPAAAVNLDSASLK
ncbi:M16 family metallopeptidase [Sphingomonas carotinifaciens]|uniref:M16 family metallopeptidase n=1 Tax=Sphingomonas carotinifaciens TaxID=1166323 RepID=UPI0039A2FC98